MYDRITLILAGYAWCMFSYIVQLHLCFNYNTIVVIKRLPFHVLYFRSSFYTTSILFRSIEYTPPYLIPLSDEATISCIVQVTNCVAIWLNSFNIYYCIIFYDFNRS